MGVARNCEGKLPIGGSMETEGEISCSVFEGGNGIVCTLLRDAETGRLCVQVGYLAKTLAIGESGIGHILIAETVDCKSQTLLTIGLCTL